MIECVISASAGDFLVGVLEEPVRFDMLEDQLAWRRDGDRGSKFERVKRARVAKPPVRTEICELLYCQSHVQSACCGDAVLNFYEKSSTVEGLCS